MIILQSVQTDTIATSGVMIGTATNIIVVGFINNLAGVGVGYIDWLVASFPVVMIKMLIYCPAEFKIFSMEKE